MKRVFPIIVAMLFLAGIFIVPVGVSDTPARLQKTSILNDVTLKQNEELSWLPNMKNVRVAVYNTTNSTEPSYVWGNMIFNNSWIMNILTSAGYSVTELNLQDIQNHELQTRNYDVLVLLDVVPNENITNLVTDFWLAGGGILATDTAGEYLNFAGIVPREAAGSNGRTTYWNYISESNFNVSNRHPVTEAYEVNQGISHLDGSLFMWDLSALSGTSLNGEFTVLVEDYDDSNNVKAIAVDPSDKGGRSVHIGIPSGTSTSMGWDEMLIDAVEWLCPRPKARIAFDLCHYPYYGMDIGDPSQYSGGVRFGNYRDSLVPKGYTFDKFFGGADSNYSLAELEPYDILILDSPGINFTASEVAAVQQWVNSGGSLFVMADAFGDDNNNIRYLMMDYDIKLNTTTSIPTIVSSDGTKHASTEGVTDVYYVGGYYVNLTGVANPIWYIGGNIIVAGQDYGMGRIVFSGDMNFLGSALSTSDNELFGYNLANWLAGDEAEVLVFTDEPQGESYWTGLDISGTQTPVANALHNLEIPYEVYEVADYFNQSLYSKTWDLVIVDAPWGGIISYLDDIEWYVDGGGRLLMSYYYINANPTHSLWAKLGFEFNKTVTVPTTTYIWDSGHPMFNVPIDYGAANFTGPRDYGTTGDRVNAFSNATVLAGYSSTPTSDNASIILRNDGQTLYNSYLINEYSDDTDDSTYEDRFELWLNQIAFMMRPVLDSPADMVVEFGSVGSTLTWTPSSDRPYRYTIDRDTVEITDYAWDGGPISVLFDGYLMGTYTFDVTVYDTSGSIATDTVVVTVEDTTYPVFVDGPDNLFYQEGTATHLLNWSFTELLPDSWVLYINGSIHDSGSWDGSEISVNAGGLTEGTYNATIAVNDTSNNVATSTVTLVVGPPLTTTTTPTGTTSTTTPTDTGTTTPPPGDNTLLIIIIAAVAGIVVIVIIILLMKKKS
ncbi:MAG: hypothetical protein ACFFF4_11635 [Candidatus Thorarchaeota archaeon]